jgi:hypothetical protein
VCVCMRVCVGVGTSRRASHPDPAFRSSQCSRYFRALCRRLPARCPVAVPGCIAAGVPLAVTAAAACCVVCSFPAHSQINTFVPRFAPARGGSLVVVDGVFFPEPALLGGVPAMVTMLVDGLSLNATVVSMSREQLRLQFPAVALGGSGASRLPIALRYHGQAHAPAQLGSSESLSRWVPSAGFVVVAVLLLSRVARRARPRRAPG